MFLSVTDVIRSFKKVFHFFKRYYQFTADQYEPAVIT
jgi:hypothetical protein